MPIPLRAFSSPSHSPHKGAKIKGFALCALFERPRAKASKQKLQSKRRWDEEAFFLLVVYRFIFCGGRIPEQLLGLLARQRFHVAQFAFDGAGAGGGGVEVFAGFVEFFADGFQHVAEFAEFVFHRAEQLPHFAAALLDG
jgi:hypothetical protein